MVKAIKNMKVNQRILIPNLLYLILLALAIFFFFSSKALIKDLSQKHKKSNIILQNMRNMAFAITSYIHKDISYQELEGHYQRLLSAMENHQANELDLANHFKQLWAQVGKIRTMRQENNRMEKEMENLIGQSTKQSDGYIEQIIKKLTDRKTRRRVPTYEVLAIKEAYINATSNYQLKALFEKLKGDLDAKMGLLSFLNTLLESQERGIALLEGTPLVSFPKNAKKANLKIKDLVLKYIKNVEEMKQISKAILDSIEKDTKELNLIAVKNNERLFNKIASYFVYLTISILLASIIGIITSVFIARSVSEVLSTSISKLSESSEQVASASKELSSVSQSLAQGASDQVSSIEETSASVEEISSMTKQNADNAAQADVLMKEARQVLDKADHSMKELIASMEEISKASEDTFKIVKSIDEIAFQTNLLALNAAVEAARAGEAGSGFAVVADEVRNLAMRSADAARNTANLIETTKKKIQEGSTLVTKTNEDFSEVGKSASKASELVTEIAAACNEQAQGIAQISSAVAQIDKVMQQNASYAQEAASASEELNQQAQRMKAVVKDLMGLIKRRDELGGSREAVGSDGSKSSEPPTAPTPKTKAESGSGRNGGPDAKLQSVKPEEVIPLNEDFEDF